MLGVSTRSGRESRSPQGFRLCSKTRRKETHRPAPTSLLRMSQRSTSYDGPTHPCCACPGDRGDQVRHPLVEELLQYCGSFEIHADTELNDYEKEKIEDCIEEAINKENKQFKEFLERKEYQRKYNKEYAKRPEVRERRSKAVRERYRNNPEFRKRKLETASKFYHEKKKIQEQK